MKRLFFSALVFAGCGEVSSMADGGHDAGTQLVDAGPSGLSAFQQQTLDAHNAVRAAAMPTPSPALPTVTWSASAASLAADWAARCEWRHRDNNSLGENLSAGTRQRTITEVVDDWASERADYDYATNTCAPGEQCGHYTQIVWRSSTTVGCAINRCTTGSPFGAGEWDFIVCNYDPAGNFTGRKPY